MYADTTATVLAAVQTPGSVGTIVSKDGLRARFVASLLTDTFRTSAPAPAVRHMVDVASQQLEMLNAAKHTARSTAAQAIYQDALQMRAVLLGGAGVASHTEDPGYLEEIDRLSVGLEKEAVISVC